MKTQRDGIRRNPKKPRMTRLRPEKTGTVPARNRGSETESPPSPTEVELDRIPELLGEIERLLGSRTADRPLRVRRDGLTTPWPIIVPVERDGGGGGPSL